MFREFDRVRYKTPPDRLPSASLGQIVNIFVHRGRMYAVIEGTSTRTAGKLVVKLLDNLENIYV